jgi:hypothetical protein
MKQMLFQFLCVLRWTNIAPTSWHHSHAFSPPEKEQSSVAVAFDAQRTIHTLDALGKSFYKHRLNKSGAKNICNNYEYAYVKGRRRENAIKQQNVMSMRLKAAKINFVTTSYDMRNAFGSVHFKIMEQVFRFLIAVEDWAVFKQRIYNTSISVPGRENRKHFEICSGPLPGDQIAADLFRITFKKALAKWIDVDSNASLLVTCPVTKEKVDVGKGCYADDLCSNHVFVSAQSKAPTANDIETVRNHHDNTFNTSVNELGLFQNGIKKRLCAPWLELELAALRELLRTKVVRGNSSVRFLDQMKYLGAWLAANGSNTPEINSRLDGAWAKWASFKHIWYDSEQPIKVKKICLRLWCITLPSLLWRLLCFLVLK